MPGCNWTFSVAFSLIDWLLGGEGKGALEPRDVTEIEELVLQNVAHIICRELGTAWEILGADFHFDGRKQRVKASRLMSPEDRILVLSFNVSLQEIRGSLQIAVPATMAAALLRELSAECSYRRPPAPAESKAQVKTSLLNCSFQADLRAIGLRIPTRDFVNLHPGDLLVFGQTVDSPATSFVDDQPMFQAFVMRHQGRRVAHLLNAFPKVQAEGKEGS